MAATSHNECNLNKQCVAVDGVGIDSCESNNDCFFTHNICTFDQKCAPVYGMAEDVCSHDSECKNYDKRCNSEKQCVSDGTGAVCSENSDCENLSCNISRQCVENGGGAECTSDYECQSLDTKCNDLGQCVPGGLGIDCLYNTDCLVGDHPPYVTNMQVAPTNCWPVKGQSRAYFSWLYMDQDLDHEISFELQIDNDSDFDSPEVSRIFTGLSYPSGTTNTQSVDVKYTPISDYGDFINFNEDYYWRVRVQDATGLFSSWTYYNENTGTFGATTTAPGIEYRYPSSHPDPWVDFGVSPTSAQIGENVNFLSSALSHPSTCYRINAGQIEPYYCEQGESDWLWDFGDESSSTAVSYTSHSYSQNGEYPIDLYITDDQGVTCSARNGVSITNLGSQETPNWREISPFK
jgi:hypothetical protein